MRPQLQSRECYAWFDSSRATTGTDPRPRHEKQTLVCRKEGATLLCTSLSVLPQSILVQNTWYRVDRCKQSYQSVTHSHWKHSILCKRFYIRTYQALLHFSNQAYIHQYFTKKLLFKGIPRDGDWLHRDPGQKSPRNYSFWVLSCPPVVSYTPQKIPA